MELGAAALILSLACDRRGLLAQILGLRLLVGIGLISYSLYLWHAHVWFMLYDWLDQPARVALAALISVTIATASYIWIEKPLQQWRHRRAVAQPAAI